MERAHASAVAIAGRGVLIRGASGAGKSCFALALIARGAVLVADDYVDLTPQDAGTLWAAPPDRLAGLIEDRGLGLIRLPYLRRIQLGLVVDLVAPDAVDRLPEPADTVLAGVRLPCLALWPWATGAAEQVERRLRCLTI